MQTHHQETVHGPTVVLSIETSPAPLRAGASSRWTLHLSEQDGGRPVNDLEVGHEKLLHLIVVSRDLQFFAHLHPEYQGDGTFTVEPVLPHAGEYRAFADYTRARSGQELARRDIHVDGAQPLPDTAHLTATVMADGGWLTTNVTAGVGRAETASGAYTVALMPMPATPVAGEDATLHFRVLDTQGAPVRDLQPYLAALSHAVIISEDAEQFLHAHPVEAGAHGGEHAHGAASGGPDVLFHTSFPRPGRYKVWAQFQHRGKVITAPFVLGVTVASEPGSGDAAATSAAATHGRHHHAG